MCLVFVGDIMVFFGGIELVVLYECVVLIELFDDEFDLVILVV